MSVDEAIRPFMRQADEEHDCLADIRDQNHTYVVDTAGKVARNQGDSQALIDALDGVTTALEYFQRFLSAMTTERVTELWMQGLGRSGKIRDYLGLRPTVSAWLYLVVVILHHRMTRTCTLPVADGITVFEPR